MRMDNEITEEQMQELHNFLTGKSLPKWMEPMRHRPWLCDQAAFNVIYYLQEQMHVLPFTYEMCKACHRLYDSDKEGFTVDAYNTMDGKPVPASYHGHYCEDCIPGDVD